MDKIIARIREWGSRLFSYAGRVMPINLVLVGIIGFWSGICTIPKMFIKEAESSCRNYLWGTKETFVRVPMMSSETVCKAKKNGGLGA